MDRLIVVAFLTAIIHMVMTFSYGVRLAGVRTGRLAIALSLYNVIFLAASTANAIQAPLLAKLVEEAINTRGVGNLGGGLFHLGTVLHAVLFAAAGGTLLGALLTPSFVHVLTRGIVALAQAGSLPKLLMMLTSPVRMISLWRSIRLPSGETVRRTLNLREMRRVNIPKGFLLLNVLISAIHATGVLSALYAGALVPEYRTTASSLSAVVNGIATVLLALAVEPAAAVLTDQALQGVRDEFDIKTMIVLLIGGRLAGTLLAQFLLLPGAQLIAWVTRVI